MPDTISMPVSAVLLFPFVVYRSHASLCTRHCVGLTDRFSIQLPDAFHERQDAPYHRLKLRGRETDNIQTEVAGADE